MADCISFFSSTVLLVHLFHYGMTDVHSAFHGDAQVYNSSQNHTSAMLHQCRVKTRVIMDLSDCPKQSRFAISLIAACQQSLKPGLNLLPFSAKICDKALIRIRWQKGRFQLPVQRKLFMFSYKSDNKIRSCFFEISCIIWRYLIQHKLMLPAETATGEMSSSSNGNPSIPTPPGSTSAAFARPPSPPRAGLQPPSPPQSSAGAASDIFGSSNSLAAADNDGWRDDDDDDGAAPQVFDMLPMQHPHHDAVASLVRLHQTTSSAHSTHLDTNWKTEKLKRDSLLFSAVLDQTCSFAVSRQQSQDAVWVLLEHMLHCFVISMLTCGYEHLDHNFCKVGSAALTLLLAYT